MKTISKHIIKEFVMPFCYTLLALFLIYLIADLFEHMDEFLRAGLTLTNIAKYYTFMLPVIFVQVSPFAFVLALIFELGLFARHNEVVALKASGISPKYIATPLIIIGLLISFSVLYCDQVLIPFSKAKIANYEKLLLKEAETTTNTDITYSNLHDHYIFLIQHLEGTNATGIQVHHIRNDGTLKACVRAKTASWLDNAWWFFDGAYIRYNENGGMIAPSDFFEKKIMTYKESPETLSQHKEASHMNFLEYRKVLKTQYGDLVPPTKTIDLHIKLSNSATCFVLGLLVIPFGLKITRSGAFSALGKTMLMTFCFYGVQTLFLVLGKQELFVAYLCTWMTPIIFGGMGILQIGRLK